MASTLNISLTETGYSVANNTSTVRAVVTIVTTNSWNLYSPYGQISFGGNAGGSYGWNHGFDRYMTTQLYETTITVSHNADGTGSVTASAYVDTDIAEGRIWASASLTLTTIPRASKPTVSGQSGGYVLGKAININMNRASSSFTHTVRWNWADHQEIIAQNVGASVSWTPPLSMASYLTMETRATCTISVNTYNGSTLIGTASVTFELSIPDSVKPTATGVTFSDASGADEGFGVILAGVSDLTATINSSQAYGAAIVKTALKFGEVYRTGGNTPLPLGVVQESGLVSVTATVTDSRGRQGTYTGTVLVYAYSAPNLSGTRAYRYNATTGQEDDEATAIRVRVKGALSEPDPGDNTGASVPANSATVTVQWMQRGGDAWTTADTSSRSGSFDYNVTLSGTFSELTAYIVRVSCTDKAGKSSTIDLVVGTAQPIIDMKATGDGVAFLGISNKAGIRANGILHLTQDSGIYLENASGESQQFIGLQSNGRPTIQNHTALANAKWLQAQLSNGNFANVLQMNASDQVELNWTTGGLRGRVHKTLWEGTLNTYGNVAISEQEYYNTFLMWVAGEKYPVMVNRVLTGNRPSDICGGGVLCNNENTGQMLAIGIWLVILNTNTLRLERCQAFTLSAGSVSSISNKSIVKIEGLL